MIPAASSNTGSRTNPSLDSKAPPRGRPSTIRNSPSKRGSGGGGLTLLGRGLDCVDRAQGEVEIDVLVVAATLR